MPHLRLACWAVASLALGSSAFGQDSSPPTPVAPPDPVNPAGLVRVSLGDWSVKTGLAAEFGVKTSEVPMTVAVTPDVAAGACPLGRDDLAQQQVVTPVQTCAAKALTPELREAVRRVVPGRS